MNIAELSIRRPVMTTLVMLAILIFGVDRLPVAAGERSAERRLSRRSRSRRACPAPTRRRWPRRWPRRWSGSSRRSPGIDSMTSTSGQGTTQITLSSTSTATSTPRRRTCRPRSPGAAPQLPPDMPTPPSYQKVEPGRPADPVPRADLADAAAVPAERVRRDDAGPAASRWSTAWPRCRCYGLAEVRGARAARSRGAGQPRRWASTR